MGSSLQKEPTNLLEEAIYYDLYYKTKMKKIIIIELVLLVFMLGVLAGTKYTWFLADKMLDKTISYYSAASNPKLR